MDENITVFTMLVYEPDGWIEDVPDLFLLTIFEIEDTVFDWGWERES